MEEEKVDYGPRFWFKVLALFLTFIGRGLCLYSIGPTLLDLIQVAHTEMHNSAFLFLAQGAGVLTGCFVVTPLQNRICPELLMAVVSLLQGVASAAIPWLNLLPLMCVALCLQGLAVGIAAVAVCTIALKIGKAKSQQLIQTIYFGGSLGGIMCPLLAQPFLSETKLLQLPGTSNYSIIGLPMKFVMEMPTLPLNSSGTGIAYFYSTPTKVMYFYLIIGCFLLLPSLTFLCLYLSERKHGYESFVADDDEKDKDDSEPISAEPTKRTCLSVVTVGMLMLFVILYFGIQDSFANLLTTFAVTSHLHLQKIEGNYLTMLFSISIAVGRLLGILLANFMKAATMLVCDLTGCIIATLVILIFYHTPYFRFVLWGMICLLGLSFSSVKASVVSWSAENLKYEKYYINIIFIARCLGLLTVPPTIVALFETIGPITLMAASGISVVFLFVLFMIMMCIVRKHPETDVNKPA